MNQTANSLENILQELATAPSCSCHIINPKVHRVILWGDIDPITKARHYTLRIGSQRFTSLTNTDKNGQTYWKFQVAGFFTDSKETVSEAKPATTSSSSIPDQTNNETPPN